MVDADLKSRVVVEPGKPALQHIVDRFGAEILQQDGNLDRAALRQQVFSDADERIWLESLLHPLIREETLRDLNSATSPYVLLVSPLLIESGQHHLASRVIVVDVPEALQLARTATRDQVSEDQVKAIMQVQSQREARLSQAHDIITNDRDLAHLHEQVNTLHQQYLAMLQEKNP